MFDSQGLRYDSKYVARALTKAPVCRDRDEKEFLDFVANSNHSQRARWCGREPVNMFV